MSRRWTQAGGAAGLASIVVALATFPLLGSSPDSSASAAQMGDYVVHRQHQLIAVGLMVTISAVLFSWFVATYAWTLHRNDGETPLGLITVVTGGAVFVLLIWDGVLEIAMVFLSHQASSVHSPTMASLYQFENGIVMPGAAGLVVAGFLAAVATAAVRGVAGGPRMGYVWTVLAVLSAAGGAIALTTVNGGMSSPLSFAPLVGLTLVAVVLAGGMLRGNGVSNRLTAPKSDRMVRA